MNPAADSVSPAAPTSPAPSSEVTWTDPARHAAFDAWLAGVAAQQGLDPATLRPASADASFRRYLRLDAREAGQPSRIVMDAPPSHEDCRPFVQVAGLLGGAGLAAPQVLAWDEAQGFMLLSDLGDRTYLAELQSLDLSGGAGLRRADGLYRDAIDTLVRLQRIDATAAVPAYDRALMQRELDLFPEWYVARHRGATLTDREREQLARCFDLILKTCLAQPAVLVHRDYHSRNLMLPLGGPGELAEGSGPGILDFQDAVAGPASYDLVSLLRDAYIEWDEAIQIDWAARYWERARKAGVPVADDFGSFWRDYEWMGLQRHLKVLGIFARLSHRDGKDGYLKDLPLVWRYAHHVAMRYSVLTPLARLLERLEDVRARDGYTF
ncbi:aminoglycoside phosphotransferase [Sphaerotilus microaerophilus]|uniref:Aminoglycoside phosphotransferase n=1 Tax=Sphaerotilus microaerophilus TaxID=2914710 RepID=A0ABN6PFY4_9BURK|nr:aminoglycoside phosphotransferase [Sphaerotilus sp. FB-5]